jgi:homoserine O-acetyltransferase
MAPKILQIDKQVHLELGETLPSINVAYHTYGNLNEERNNVIWVCHALTANSEADDWWPNMIGEGKTFDTDQYFVVCANIIGSCYGSTGPLSTNPDTGLPWYRSFPAITFRDIVDTFEALRLHLGIQKIHTIAGGSIGGFQALEYSIMHPDLIENLVFIASSVALSPWAIAFNESQRLAIEADQTFSEDRPYGGIQGLKAARSVALLSYRNDVIYNQRQKETDSEKTDHFRASSYQDYQGDKLVKRFDAYSYYGITKLMDTHNIARGRGSLTEAAGRITANVLSVGISSDLIFPTNEQRLLAHLTEGTYEEIDSIYGHDGFLVETEKIGKVIREFWEKRNVVDHRKRNASLTLQWSRSA